MTDKPIYRDFNASTPIAPEVVEAMRPYLTAHWRDHAGFFVGAPSGLRTA